MGEALGIRLNKAGRIALFAKIRYNDGGCSLKTQQPRRSRTQTKEESAVKKCKITVLKREFYHGLAREYIPIPDFGPCHMQSG